MWLDAAIGPIKQGGNSQLAVPVLSMESFYFNSFYYFSAHICCKQIIQLLPYYSLFRTFIV
jgi:hypothetical protein